MTSKELQTARRTLRMTQQELASCLGVARNTVSRWECGAWTIPKATTMTIDFLVKAVSPAR